MTQGRNPIHWFPDQFPQSVERAKEQRGYDRPQGEEGDWGFLTRGKTLGKSAMVKFSSVNSAIAAQSNVTEILRINPRGPQADQLAKQISLTIAPPQVLPGISFANLPADANTPTGGWMDSIDIAAGSNSADRFGGNPIRNPAPSTLDWQFANPLAVIQWGTGSIQNEIEADMANGMVLDLVCSWLVVFGIIESAGITTTSGGYLVGANIGPSTGRNSNCQRTVQLGAIDNNVVGNTFAVPRFAKSVQISATDGSNNPPLAAATLSFWRSQGGPTDGLGAGDFFIAGNNPVPIPIPNGAYYFNVRGAYAASGGGFAAPRYQATFNLAP